MTRMLTTRYLRTVAFIALVVSVMMADGLKAQQITSGAKNHGIVIADVQFAGRKIGCGRPSAYAIRATGDDKSGSGGSLVAAGYLFVLTNAPKPQTFAPGRYWIIRIECHVTPRLTLNAKYKGMFPQANNFVSGIATFEVMPGEVVNIGTIQVSMAARAVRVQRGFDPEVAALFQKEYPQLAARMVHRPARTGGN